HHSPTIAIYTLSLHDALPICMHRHFTDGSSILMFGGGVKKGFVYGKTADERPCKTIEKPIRIERIHQSIYHALGIDPQKNVVVEGRPFYTTPDGVHKAELELFI